MNINVIQDQTTLPLSDASVRRLVTAFCSAAQVQYDEVTIHFIDTKEMCALHAEFFDDPSPTDCISFPMDDPEEATSGYKVMGDVFVCPDTAAAYVKEHGGDIYEETTLYTIHGLLHLIGYDDIDEGDRAAMRSAESFHIERLKAKNLWLCA